jgi:hypothetical protein
MALSIKNGWFDEENRAFIYYTLENIMEDLGCGREKSVKILAELDYKKGIGLIEKKRQGLGKPDIIYVKNFVRPSNWLFQTGQNNDSGQVKVTTQEAPKQQCNKTKINNTEYSDNYLINQKEEGIDERHSVRKHFMEQLSFDYLQKRYAYQTEMLEELLELIVDTVCSKRSTIQIAGDSKPLAVVKGVFMKLECSHIQYVMDALQSNATEVKNIKSYLLAMLYNAPLTINSYYTTLFNHDRANGKI